VHLKKTRSLLIVHWQRICCSISFPPLQALIGWIEPIKSQVWEPEAESLPAFTSATVLEQFRNYCGMGGINEAASDNNQSCPAGGGPKYPWLLDESAMAKQREPAS
jgi:hypothetical protein